MTNELEQLEEIRRSKVFKLPDNPKPCIIAMLNNPQHTPPQGRNWAVFAIAVEMRRRGTSQKKALEALLQYRDDAPTRPGNPFTVAEVTAAVRSAYKARRGGYYQFGCSPTGDLYNSGFCVGHEACIYYQELLLQNASKKKIDKATAKRQNPEYLARLGWLSHLTGNAVKLYLALTVLEKERGFAPGSLLCASYEHLLRLSGISGKKSLRQAAEELAQVGLITFKPGTTRGHASELRRLIPIQVPPPQRVHRRWSNEGQPHFSA